MNHADPYGVGGDDHDELPPLPIPRPGEWPAATTTPQPAERIAPPALGGGLGGGASFTAAGSDDLADAPGSTPSAGAPLPQPERQDVESERFTWGIAAQLTSGMLANPARANISAKEAMGLFDQFLQELHAYAKIASEFDLLGGEAERRRSHEEYFQQRVGRPETAAPASQHAIPMPMATPKPGPAQPRPIADYRPVPPGAPTPYAPGSMAGAPPPERHPGDDERAA